MKALAEKLQEHLVETPEGCLEFRVLRGQRKGQCPSGTGYGQLYDHPRKRVSAHVLAWELHHGTQVPEGMLVCHVCDNPPCCNPEHLFVGTYQDNNQDRVDKGRHVAPRPTHCPKGHEYTTSNAVRYSDGGLRCRECRRLYKVQRRTR